MPSPPDLPYEDLNWIRNGEPASASNFNPPQSDGIQNRPTAQLLGNDKFLRERVNLALTQLAQRETVYVLIQK